MLLSRLGACVCAAFLSLGTVAGAADVTKKPASAAAPFAAASTWSGDVTLYGWAMGLNGTVQTFSRVPPVQANVGFDQVLRNLDGGLMLAASATNGQVVFLGDMILAKLSPKKNFATGRFDGSLTLDVTNFIGLAAGGYRVYADPTWSLDLLVGARVFVVDAGVTLSLPRIAAQIADRNKSWVDGVLGFRAIYNVTDRLHLTAIAFGGGLSSQYEWDVFGSVGYDFTSYLSGFVGYRALGVNYKSDGFVYDVVQHGPLVGLSLRF